jgi:hypothetical protein
VKWLHLREEDPFTHAVSFDEDVWAFDKHAAVTRPSGAKTGLPNPRCYASCLGDCVELITEEHYFSRAILEQIANDETMVKVGGVPRADSQTRDLPVARLVSNILCERHNNALSPLDTAASKLFEYEFTHTKQLEAGKNVLIGTCGHDIERWSLKWLCGILAMRKRQIPDAWVRILFGEDEMLQPVGLYEFVREGDVLDRPNLAELSIAVDGGEPIGCKIALMNLAYVLAMTDKIPQDESDTNKWRMYRPSGVRTHYTAKNGKTFHAVCGFAWQGIASRGAYDTIWTPAPKREGDAPRL